MSGSKVKIQKLILQAQRGDSDAVSTIYQTYIDRIYRYIVYRVGSESDAEDLTAEVFVNMVEGLSRYKDTGAPFESWLYRIASARVADFYRKREKQPLAELPENMVDSELLPEEQMLEQQEISELQKALGQLKEDEQQVLILRFVERKSHRVVAEILDKQVSAIKNIQYRALTKLSTLLGSEKKPRHYLRGDDD
jgi:RNA polymerase sigma-70 factor, ECF subfamily